ncbi:hypothetical protein KKE34_01865 [Patescibacteria group bacterium]|nr:hypothetical protein [Patescibacteria group bacterium]MBU1885333.1 hypothetical protein [Patescibacteria group bacterium]
MKKLLFLVAVATVFAFTTSPVMATNSSSTTTSFDSIVTKIQEGVEYFFTFKVEKKVELLEKYAEKRLVMTQEYAKEGDDEKVQNTMQNYLQIKEKQNNLLGKNEAEGVLGVVQERTIDQQKTMEVIKTIVGEEMKQEVMQVQEQVVNQVVQRVVDVNGTEGRDEFFQKVEHVWAPGTGPGGEAGTTFAPGTSGTGGGGVVIEGGSIQFAPGTGPGGNGGVVIEGGAEQYAPGTSGGGNSGADIKNVEVVGN